MILPPFDASRRDESNDIWLDFVRSLDGRLFDFSHFYKNRIKPNRTAGFSVRFLRISALIRTVYNPDQTDPFGALLHTHQLKFKPWHSCYQKSYSKTTLKTIH